jgi:hypothetical protein
MVERRNRILAVALSLGMTAIAASPAHAQVPECEEVESIGDFPDWNGFGSLDRDHRLLAMGLGRELRVFDAASLATIVTIPNARFGGVSADGRLAYGIADFNRGPAALWDLTTRREIARFATGTSVAIGERFVAVSGRADARVLRYPDLAEVVRFDGLERVQLHEPLSLAFAYEPAQRQGQAFSGGKSSVLVWDIDAGKERARLTHEGLTNFFIPVSGSVAATWSEANRDVRLWDLGTGRMVAHHRGYIGASARFGDGAPSPILLQPADRAAAWAVIDPARPEVIRPAPMLAGATFAFHLATNRAFVPFENRFLLWDPTDGRTLLDRTTSRRPNFTPLNDRYVLVAVEGSPVLRIDIETGQEQRFTAGDQVALIAYGPGPRSGRFATFYESGSRPVTLHEADGSPLCTAEGGTKGTRALVTSNGDLLAIGDRLNERFSGPQIVTFYRAPNRLMEQAIAAYEKGDFIRALMSYTSLAEQGNAVAQFNLAVMLDKNEGTPADPAKAAEFYRFAAAQGHLGAQLNLGVLYSNGRGVKQDYAEAMALFRRAAERGSAKAQFNIGTMYELGEGVAKNPREASVWYRKAALQGDGRAQLNLGSR